MENEGKEWENTTRGEWNSRLGQEMSERKGWNLDTRTKDKVRMRTDKEMAGLECLRFNNKWISWDRVMTEIRRVKSRLKQTEGNQY